MSEHEELLLTDMWRRNDAMYKMKDTRFPLVILSVTTRWPPYVTIVTSRLNDRSWNTIITYGFIINSLLIIYTLQKHATFGYMAIRICKLQEAVSNAATPTFPQKSIKFKKKKYQNCQKKV